MKISIKAKLAFILSVVLFFTSFLMGAIMIYHQRGSLGEQMRSMSGTITDEFANDTKVPLLQNDSLAMNLLVQNILTYPGIKDAYILDHDFTIRGHREISEVGSPFGERAEGITGAFGKPPWLISRDDESLAFAAPIIFQNTTVGYTVIYFSNQFINERVRAAITSMVVLALFSVAAVSLLSIPIASGLLRPIFRLSKGTCEIAKGNLDYRIPAMSKDELGDLVISFNRMASELKKKEVLKGVFNRYVSQHVADEILKDPERIRLGGDKKHVTVFFADIRGFASLSRRLSPEEIVELLNRYFTIITEVVFAFEGTVDKFIGDAVMSVFGSPIASERHIEQGIKAGAAINAIISKVNHSRQGQGLVPLSVGIGLDSGQAIVGNMGSKMRMEFTAVGEAVNMASRLSDIAGAGDLIISEQVYNSIKGHVIAEKIVDRIKGVDTPIIIYNVTGLSGLWKDDVDEIVQKTMDNLEKEEVIAL